jgi:hypothetical protein
MLGLAVALFGQQPGREQYDLIGWNTWPKGSTLTITGDGMGIRVFGRAGANAAGYVIESNNLGLSGKRKIILKVSGITGKEQFDSGKLMKLEINDTALRTGTPNGSNRDDPGCINARNSEYEFDVSRIRQIGKINFVFFNCTIAEPGFKIEMFVE